ncbi:MAG TPA: 4Fe-4S binding protein, partial [Sinorhizobium sp.]|nr:4Fe-4S binding protein [Sinorhizobium sp.]
MTMSVIPPDPLPDIWQRIGDWLARHQRQIGWMQWGVVCAYAGLLVVPVFLPLPDNAAHIWDNFSRFAR